MIYLIQGNHCYDSNSPVIYGYTSDKVKAQKIVDKLNAKAKRDNICNTVSYFYEDLEEYKDN